MQLGEKKKKFLWVTKNIAFNQTTFVWREDFAFNQIIFFLSLEEFYYDFCFFTKIFVLKRKAFSHRYATSRWQTSEKEKIFGGEKKLIHFEVQRGNLFWTLVILLIKHEKLLDNGTTAHFPFRVGCTQFFLSFHFFCHVKSSKLFDVSFWERMKIIRKNLCKAFFTIWWILLLKTFWWKILENHFKNIHRATLYVNKRGILLVLDRQEKVFNQKIFLN